MMPLWLIDKLIEVGDLDGSTDSGCGFTNVRFVIRKAS